MNFPLISEYVEAVKMAEDNFDELCHLRLVLDKDGQPVMSSGNFAVVFKMRDTESGKFHAVRCFHREQEGRAESYRQIEEALRQVQSPYLVSFRYMDKELFVDSKQTGGETEFPVLLMDWVEGVTLDRYIREHIDDKDALEVLAYRFSLMASWLIAQPFAHGDLKPDNILVRPDGTITLIDYDGMFVPSMQGQSARELGSPDFRHPLRKEADFDGSIDDFPLVSILLSLKAIAVNPSLLDLFGASDRLLFSEVDYRDIRKCRVLHEIFPSSDNELNKVISLFILALTERKFVGVSPNILEFAEPACFSDEELSTKVTREDLAEAVEDEFGVKYSKDGRRLLKGAYTSIKEYAVREGTKVICDEAFSWCRKLTSINIPSSVKKIGKGAFWRCISLTSINIPDSVTEIGEMAFRLCVSLTSINIPDSVTEIGNGAFSAAGNLTQITVHPDNPRYDSREDCNAIICTKGGKVVLIAGCKNTHIPDSVTEIGEMAFLLCGSLTSINIPDSVTEIGNYAFSGGKSLTQITVHPDNPNYDSREDCNAIICTKAEKVVLIAGCKNTHIPDSVTEIGKGAFGGCESLTSINIPNSVTEIGERAFWLCVSLTSINIPNSVTKIGEGAFEGCVSLTSINIPDSVTKIGKYAFGRCDSLTSINIPNSVTEIEEGAFEGCVSLTSINIPQNTREKFAKLLPDYKHPLLIEI